MKRIKVLIVDDISDTRESIRRLLEFEKDIEVIGEAGNGSEALRQAEKLLPDIVLMDINMPEMDGIRTTELLSLRVPNTSVVIMSVQGEQAYLRRAMMAGAREYIVKPFSGDELANAIVRVHEMEHRKREALGEPRPVQIPEKTRNGEIISIFSTKGGVGKTTIAANLAVHLASSGKWRVLLVDLNLQFGDVAVFLNLVPRRTIADLAQSGTYNFEDIKSFLLTHSSGLQVLAAPTRPEYAELVNQEHLESIIKECKEHFDFIIFDNVSRFEDISLYSLDIAQQIWLVVAMEIPSLKNAKLSLEVLEGLHHSDKVKLIVNRASKEMGMEIKDVEKSLGFPVSFEIVSDGKILVSALNSGQPFIRSHPQSKAAEGIRKMAESLTQMEVSIEKDPAVEKNYLKPSGIRKVFGF